MSVHIADECVEYCHACGRYHGGDTPAEAAAIAQECEAATGADGD